MNETLEITFDKRYYPHLNILFCYSFKSMYLQFNKNKNIIRINYLRIIYTLPKSHFLLLDLEMFLDINYLLGIT